VLVRLHERLGQPRADIRIPFRLRRPQAVDRQPRDHGHQPGFARLKGGMVGFAPAQPGVLQHVLCIRAHAEHAVGDAEEARAQRGEGGGIGSGGHGCLAGKSTEHRRMTRQVCDIASTDEIDASARRP
jgi:hypothetical protein